MVDDHSRFIADKTHATEFTLNGSQRICLRSNELPYTSKTRGQRISRLFAVLSPLAASFIAIGLAGPASATDQITQNAVGTYKVQYPWGTYVWVAAPCEDGANQCIKVTEFTTDDIGLTRPRWSTNAYWSVGWWLTLPVDAPDELVCGGKYTLTFTYAWDAVENTGWRSYRNPEICDGGKDARGTQPFGLTKSVPQPPPSAAE